MLLLLREPLVRSLALTVGRVVAEAAGRRTTRPVRVTEVPQAARVALAQAAAEGEVHAAPLLPLSGVLEVLVAMGVWWWCPGEQGTLRNADWTLEGSLHPDGGV